MGFSLKMTQIYIAVALCGLSIADNTQEAAQTTSLLTQSTPAPTQSPIPETSPITSSSTTSAPINTQLIVIVLIAIMLCLIGICVALLIAIRKQSQQRHKDSAAPTISMRVQSITSELEAIEGKSPSYDSADSKAVVDMAAAMRAHGVSLAIGDRMVPSDSTKSLSSMMSVTAQSQSMQFYDAHFDAQLANAAQAIMLNAGGPLKREIPEFVPDQYVEDMDAMRYVDAYHVGMNDREVSAEDDDDEVVLEMLTPTADGQ